MKRTFKVTKTTDALGKAYNIVYENAIGYEFQIAMYFMGKVWFIKPCDVDEIKGILEAVKQFQEKLAGK